MAKFIEVTVSAVKTLVNVNKILYVSDHGSNAYICLGEEVRFPIDETYEEIKAMLEDEQGINVERIQFDEDDEFPEE